MGQRAFCPTQKGVLPRLWGKTPTQMEKIIELFLPYIASFCGFIVISLKNDMSTTQNVQIFIYKTAFKISMSKLLKGVRLVPPTLLLHTWNSNHDYCLQIKWPKRKKKMSLMGLQRVTHRLIGKKSMTIRHGLTD